MLSTVGERSDSVEDGEATSGVGEWTPTRRRRADRRFISTHSGTPILTMSFREAATRD